MGLDLHSLLVFYGTEHQHGYKMYDSHRRGMGLIPGTLVDVAINAPVNIEGYPSVKRDRESDVLDSRQWPPRFFNREWLLNR